MARLEIKKSPNVSEGLTLKDYDVLVDGHEISGLVSLDICLGIELINTVDLQLQVDDFSVDADFIATLEARVDDLKTEGD